MNSKFVFVREKKLCGNDEYNYNLARADFSDAYVYPKVEKRKLAKWAKLLLEMKGFRIAKDGNADIVFPINDDYIEITAPLYEATEAGYVDMCSEYTETWANPKLCELAEKALKEVRDTTKEQLHQIFMEMFNKNSVDGKIALFEIWLESGFGIQ